MKISLIGKLAVSVAAVFALSNSPAYAHTAGAEGTTLEGHLTDANGHPVKTGAAGDCVHSGVGANGGYGTDCAVTPPPPPPPP
ncbi:MAG: hypothetical protein WCE43_10260, partial [Burkholderiales bacterium]